MFNDATLRDALVFFRIFLLFPGLPPCVPFGSWGRELCMSGLSACGLSLGGWLSSCGCGSAQVLLLLLGHIEVCPALDPSPYYPSLSLEGHWMVQLHLLPRLERREPEPLSETRLLIGGD